MPIVMQALTVLGTNPKYLPGYFKAEATALNIDAWVWFTLLKEKLPKLHAHLLKVGVQPDMYCQKYFGGLCIHVLPFRHLFSFLDGFFQEGFRFSFKFAFALLEELEPVLMKLHSHSTIMAVL